MQRNSYDTTFYPLFLSRTQVISLLMKENNIKVGIGEIPVIKEIERAK